MKILSKNKRFVQENLKLTFIRLPFSEQFTIEFVIDGKESNPVSFTVFLFLGLFL